MRIKILAVRRGVEVKFCSELLKGNYKRCQKIKQKLEWLENSESYSFFYVAKEENLVIGFLYAYMVSRSGELMYHSTAVLESLIVEPKYRNQGIATSLMEIFLETCHNHNIKMLETDVFHKNGYMQKIYWGLNLRRYCYRMRINFEEETV